jgi:hypothetical protein
LKLGEFLDSGENLVGAIDHALKVFDKMAQAIGPRLYSCCNCRNHVGLHDDIISKAFQVNHLDHFFCFVCVPYD